MQKYFSALAIEHLRSAIAEANGNEVFFLGRTDEARVVVAVEPLARGNKDAVPAIMIACSFGDVVIHNHPSGNLTPSQPDIEIASLLGNQGVGFYIVNNDASRANQVVAPFARKVVERLSYPEVEHFYAPDGVLAQALPGYEHRPEQTRMALNLSEAFNEEKVAIVEAGTGTGKSLAYLLPAALWSVRNKERVVVSTNTINLQEQLIQKDIPFLQQHAGVQFRAVLVKGRGNYLCLRKLRVNAADASLFKDDTAQELDAIVAWSKKTEDGCRGDLAFIPKDEVWEELCCESDQCGRVKCPEYPRCFFYKARREAAGADLLVVNHALLLADLSVRQETGYDATAILPPFTRLVFDEGHHLEDVATSFLSSQVSRLGLVKLLGKLQHPRKAHRGVLPQLSTQLSAAVPESQDDLYLEIAEVLEGRLIPRRVAVLDAVTRGMDQIGEALFRKLKKDGVEQKLRVTPAIYSTPLWQEVTPHIEHMAKELSDYALAMQAFLKGCEKLSDKVLEKLAGPLTDLRGVKGRIECAVDALRFFMAREDEFCRWFELRKGPLVKLCSSPLEVAESIKKAILDRFKTVVLTSATLAIGEKFDFLKHRTGIELLAKDRVSELLLPSPFDYAHQALVAVPSDMPEPTSPMFEARLCSHLLDALRISQGRAFVLFTSYDLLIRVFNRLAEPLKAAGLTPMRQGETNRHMLLSKFRNSVSPVLFGTDSFWEGVDVQGRGLELVVITRLPFRVPTEPILEARSEHITAKGGDPFMSYTVPQAVIKFKQGFGRLIRSKEDRGAVLILDSRVLTKNYGKIFLTALHGVTVQKSPEEEICRRLQEFFAVTPPT
ncbi:DEAD/DEAH box helicase family protein [Geomonas sp. Red69]|uniref:helicase C-terminal domain-containing protein n=1 Tax=Geomonas diazotrophica TaxID=2843197 RepID=UPI001C11F4F2|nr:helicase C-terminal domain-containing protein [Geomonas diazotrophica]MBU5638062.1 DEAD/DEAH box helicase family protein [Geomonas diazotrophica]